MSQNPYKKLGGQTIVYGLGTMIPRLLNYLILTAYYTRVLNVQEFGLFTEIYAYISIFMVILTFGFETGYFKYSTDFDRDKLFSTSILAIAFFVFIFIFLCFLFIRQITSFLEYGNYPVYIKWAAIIVGFDALTNLFIAKLRMEEKTKRFIFVQLLNVVLTIALVLFFLEVLPKLVKENKFTFLKTYPGKVYLILVANLLASLVRLSILFFKELRNFKFVIDFKLLKLLLLYSLPLLLAQLSGIFNEALDRILLRHFLLESYDKLYELGIYGANIRIAVLMTLFIQMFRYAAEPFYFSHYKEENSKVMYSNIMNYFVVFCMAIFLLVLLYIDYFKFFIDSKFHEGLTIVPIMLFSSFLTGIIFNLSIWYKLNKKTYYGIYIIGSGALLTILMNIFLIPKYGYFGCAITHLVSNIFMVLLSYIWGQKYYKIPYQTRKIFLYCCIALGIYFVSKLTDIDNLFISTVKNTVLYLLFIALIVKKENLINIFFKNYESKDS